MDIINPQSLESLLCYAKDVFQKRRVLCQSTLLKYHPKERVLAVRLTEKGVSRLQIAKELGISVSAVNAWVVKEKKKGLLQPPPRCLTVIPETIQEVPLKSLSSKNIETCKISIARGVTIKIAVSAVNSFLLTEIKKAVESC